MCGRFVNNWLAASIWLALLHELRIFTMIFDVLLAMVKLHQLGVLAIACGKMMNDAVFVIDFAHNI